MTSRVSLCVSWRRILSTSGQLAPLCSGRSTALLLSVFMSPICSWRPFTGGLSPGLYLSQNLLGTIGMPESPPHLFPHVLNLHLGWGGTRRILNWGSVTPIPRLVECPTWGQGGSDGGQTWLCSQSSWAVRCTEEVGAQQRPRGPGLKEAAQSIVP